MSHDVFVWAGRPPNPIQARNWIILFFSLSWFDPRCSRFLEYVHLCTHTRSHDRRDTLFFTYLVQERNDSQLKAMRNSLKKTAVPRIICWIIKWLLRNSNQNSTDCFSAYQFIFQIIAMVLQFIYTSFTLLSAVAICFFICTIHKQ